MKSKGILIAAGAVGILSAFAFWDYYQGEKSERTKEQTSKLFTLNSDQVNFVEIARKDDKVVLKRDVDGWSLVEPVQDVADNGEVENYLKELLEEKSLDVVKEGEGLPWGEYQLSPPYATITVKDQAGKSESVDISEMMNYESRVFARRGTENKVLTVNANFKSRAQDTNIRFRERKLYRGKLSAVNRVHFRLKGSDRIDITKNEAQEWVNKKDPAQKLDQNKVREVLTQISETRVSNYLLNGPSKAADRQRYGYGAVIGVLTLETAEGKWTAEISLSQQQDFMAVTSKPEFLVRMEPGHWEKYEKMGMSSLVDPSVFFGFDAGQVQSVVVVKDKKETVYKKKDGVWEDPKYVEGLFKSLAGVSLKEISSKSQLKSVETSVQLRGEGNTVLFSVEQGLVDEKVRGLKTSKAKNVLIPEVELAL